MNATLCHETVGLAFPIALYQLSRNRFMVIYGQEIRRGLTYSEAAAAYGQSIMHALACDGRVTTIWIADNEA